MHWNSVGVRLSQQFGAVSRKAKRKISWQARVAEMKCRFRGAGGVGGGRSASSSSTPDPKVSSSCLLACLLASQKPRKTRKILKKQKDPKFKWPSFCYCYIILALLLLLVIVILLALRVPVVLV